MPVSASAAPEAPHTDLRQLVVVTLWIAIVTGLVEAAGSVALMKAGNLPGVWWDVFWASPAFDVLFYGAVGVVLHLVARALRRPTMDLVLPAFGFLTASIWLGLALPYQVHIAALVLLSAGCAYQFTRLVRRRFERVLRFWERSLPAVVALGVIAALTVLAGRPLRERLETAGLPAARPDAPSVVLIVVDALRADHVSAHGYARPTSPTLERLASEGAAFHAAFSTSPYTAPSHASLLTGLYASEHGAQWLDRRPLLADAHPTLGEALLARGYRTAAFSANRFWFTREQGFGRGFLRFEDNFHSLGDAFARTAYGRKLEEWVLRRLFEDYPWRVRADAVTDAASEWALRDPERPFFVMLNYFDVHDPYFPPEPFRARFSHVPEPGGILNSHQGRYLPELTAAELAEEIDAYDGAVVYVDQEIDRLLANLAAAGSARDLVVVVTSDHGEAFGEHGTYIHANSLYLEEIHVPLIVWSPGRVPAGFGTDLPVTNAAVPSTILGLVDPSAGDGLGKASLAALWRSAAVPEGHASPVSEMEHWPWNLDASPSHYGAIRALIDPEYHYIRNDSLGAELYRWREDPREATNLVEEEGLRSVVERLEAELQGVRGGDLRPAVSRSERE